MGAIATVLTHCVRAACGDQVVVDLVIRSACHGPAVFHPSCLRPCRPAGAACIGGWSAFDILTGIETPTFANN